MADVLQGTERPIVVKTCLDASEHWWTSVASGSRTPTEDPEHHHPGVTRHLLHAEHQRRLAARGGLPRAGRRPLQLRHRRWGQWAAGPTALPSAVRRESSVQHGCQDVDIGVFLPLILTCSYVGIPVCWNMLLMTHHDENCFSSIGIIVLGILILTKSSQGLSSSCLEYLWLPFEAFLMQSDSSERHIFSLSS